MGKRVVGRGLSRARKLQLFRALAEKAYSKRRQVFDR